jgi:hypothetical protein
MRIEAVLSVVVALIFACVHVVGGRLTFLRTTPRSVWLSIAGGVSAAYVFIHLLPELAEYQETYREALRKQIGSGGLLAKLEHHTYMIALSGLAVFYGLDRLARQSVSARRAGADGPGLSVFWIHLGAFAAYNLLIGYLLLHREENGLRGLVIYAVAMGLHFLVNDQGLREQHGAAYDLKGWWILAATPLIGWGIGATTEIAPLLLSALFAFLAGGVVLNVLKEELPEDRGRFWAFAAGAAVYTAILLATG